MKKVEWDEVRDKLIDGFCNERCPGATDDYYCPDYNCPIWRTLAFCTTENLKEGRDDQPGKR